MVPGSVRCVVSAVDASEPRTKNDERKTTNHERRTTNQDQPLKNKNGHSPSGSGRNEQSRLCRPGLPAASLRPDQAGDAGKGEPALADGVHAWTVLNLAKSVKSGAIRQGDRGLIARMAALRGCVSLDP
jgi:hypothetical protein